MPIRTVIEWRDPVRPNRTRTPRGIVSQWASVAEQLRTRPGRWALIGEDMTIGAATGLATHIRLGQIKAFTPTGDYDALSERQPHGGHQVFAVYLGEPDETDRLVDRVITGA